MKICTSGPGVLAACLLLSSHSLAAPQDPAPSGYSTPPGQQGLNLKVSTTSGEFIGHHPPNAPEVAEFLGIPYAEPPINDLRFAAPILYRSNATRNADKQPKSCLQLPASTNSSYPQNFQNIQLAYASYADHTSEDCLYMNIWTQHPNEPKQKRPVMIWFYGGGFHAGGASDDAQQGTLWVREQDVVHVNFNYRLGIFGFSGAPGLSQNVALLDQRLAVEWVRDNIAQFGGDPSKIVIFGHSAGGASVDMYNYIWLDDPIISGTIAMSSTATSFGRRYQNTTEAAFNQTAKLLNCTKGADSSKSEVLACVRGKPAEAVFNASLTAAESVDSTLSRVAKVYAGITGIYGPTVDNKLVFLNYTTQAAQGKVLKTPLVTGNNDDEGCFFTEKGQIPKKADPFVTQAIFTCPVEYAALYRAENNVPTWKYRYYGSYPNLELNACPGRPWHGQELYVMFGSSELASKQNATGKEIAQGRYFRKAFTAFAHDPTKALSRIAWPKYNNHKNEVAGLGRNSSLDMTENVKQIDKTCFTVFQNGGPLF